MTLLKLTTFPDGTAVLVAAGAIAFAHRATSPSAGAAGGVTDAGYTTVEFTGDFSPLKVVETLEQIRAEARREARARQYSPTDGQP